MRLSIKIIVGAAIVAASVAAATFGASAPAAAAEQTLRGQGMQSDFDVSARKRSVKNGTRLRVFRLSRNAAASPNPNRPYYRPVPHFYPFAQNRGYF